MARRTMAIELTRGFFEEHPLQDGRLNLHGTKVTGARLGHLQTMPGLQELYLGETDVTDDELKYLQGIKGLRVLGLRGTKVTDGGLS
jgi:hypothetical protein